jgi:hypothetical protein
VSDLRHAHTLRLRLGAGLFAQVQHRKAQADREWGYAPEHVGGAGMMEIKTVRGAWLAFAALMVLWILASIE